MEITESTEWAALIVQGISTGCIYGILGLAIGFTYRAARVGNFAQANMATFSAYIMYSLLHIFSFYIAFALTLFLAFVYGAAIHVFIIRKIRANNRLDTEFVAMIITIGLMTIFSGLSRILGGSMPKIFPPMFPETSISYHGIIASYRDVGIVGVTILLAISLSCFFRFTRLGLALEAAAENKLAAGLRGVRIHHMLTLSWGISSAVGTLSGVLIAPVLGLSPGMLGTIFLFAYTASVVGGLKSPIGTLAGGVIVGIVENLSSTVPAVGSELKTVVVFLFLIATLYIWPRGIFGRPEMRRV